MPQYQIKISTSGDGVDAIRLANDAVIVGLADKVWTLDGEDKLVPDTYIHFSHLLSSWTDDYPAQKLNPPVHKFYGGMGEGEEFDRWQDAIHASLYDLFQVHEGLHDGDMFAVTYNGETQFYRCDGVHVIATSVFEEACKLPGVIEL